MSERTTYQYEEEAKRIQGELCPLCGGRMCKVGGESLQCSRQSCRIIFQEEDWHQKAGWAVQRRDRAGNVGNVGSV